MNTITKGLKINKFTKHKLDDAPLIQDETFKCKLVLAENVSLDLLFTNSQR